MQSHVIELVAAPIKNFYAQLQAYLRILLLQHGAQNMPYQVKSKIMIPPQLLLCTAQRQKAWRITHRRPTQNINFLVPSPTPSKFIYR
jgi:hypothetical protein